LSITVFSVFVTLLFLPANSRAVPPCSQIDASFCFPDPNCEWKEIEWSGSCTNNPPDRQWRCVWHDCSGEGYEPTEYGEWTPCCPGGQGVQQCDCLLAGTLITLADGSTKPVETIAIGDVVLSFDESSKTMKPAAVVATHAPFETNHYRILNGNLRLTEAHPVLMNGRWVNAGDVKVGDALTDLRGHAVRIISIEEVNDSAPTYNFQVSTGTYVAGGIVVHNKENCEHFMQYPSPNRPQ
jgi:pretoxin HINT domain-containing protein